MQVDHYWFNGRAGTPEQQAAKIVGTYDGVKIEADEDLWWDVEDEGSLTHWTPAEVVTYAKALAAKGIPIERQGVYLSSSVTRQQDWSPVVDLGLRLWVADYGTNDGNISSKPLVGYWDTVTYFQYTSTGHLPGYEGNLDLNVDGKIVWTVHDLQAALNKLYNLGLDEDGDFGPATKAGVIRFQQDNKLVVDGDPGWNTLTALEKRLGLS